jgi:flagellar FliL protein
MSKAKKKPKDSDDEGKPKGGFVKMIIFAVVLLAIGAGGAYGAFAAGLIGGGEDVAEDNSPKLILKGEEDPYAPADDKKDKDAVSVVHGEGGSKYRTAYYSFTEPFTSNLAGSSALIQVDLAASTQRDGRVLQWIKQHELAVRSALLTELANTPEEDLYSSKGKEALRKRLAKAINDVLTENEGFGGVDAVHFKALLIQ